MAARSKRAKTAAATRQALNKLVGTWKVTGGARGTVRYEWFDGKSALIQYVRLGKARGFEVIRFDAQSQSLRSWFFDRSGSQVLEYTYEIDDRTLKISIDMPDRHGAFVAQFSDRGRVLEGRWDWVQNGEQKGYDARLMRMPRAHRSARAS